MQAGVELFGESSQNADTEVISLLLESLHTIGMPDLNIDLGHVAIYRSLAAAAGFSKEQEQAFFDLLQKKSSTDINDWIEANLSDATYRRWFAGLPELAGDVSTLARAREVLAGAPDSVFEAIDAMAAIAEIINQRWPQVNLYYDLSEVRGYHYHTGIVFAAFAAGMGDSIARGGRYDNIGKVFGRARPAIGFTVDISAVNRLLNGSAVESLAAVFVPYSSDQKQWQVVQDLRRSGRRVVCALNPDDTPPSDCREQLVVDGDQVQLLPINEP